MGRFRRRAAQRSAAWLGKIDHSEPKPVLFDDLRCWFTIISRSSAATLAPVNKLAARVCRQIERYLDDPQFRFDLPFEFRGTQFQERVWRTIYAIPCGSTSTYVGVAKQVKSAPRPVGGACGANRIPLVIPCHRVLASGGIGGFMHARDGAPLEIKRWLLRHEHALPR